jgi:transcriptional regulator with XRE-family HTH domain
MARTYAEAVRDIRLERGMTVAALASASGLESSVISAVERGEDDPPFTTMIDLARCLGIPTVTLVEEGLGGAGHSVKKLSINDLAKRGGHYLTPEYQERIRSAFENDQQELLVELHEDLETWAAVEVALALTALKPDEISCVAPGIIYLWWDKSLAHLPAT